MSPQTEALKEAREKLIRARAQLLVALSYLPNSGPVWWLAINSRTRMDETLFWLTDALKEAEKMDEVTGQ